MPNMPKYLENYHQLVERADTLCRSIQTALGDRITCAEGCSDCCTSITLFPVEAVALNSALNCLPDEIADAIRKHVAEHASGERCPLLEHRRCLLYHARPIICRTHGLPILYNHDDERRVDCCPRNDLGNESLPGSSVIDLERLNALLVAINALFISQTETAAFPERISIADALAIKLNG